MALLSKLPSLHSSNLSSYSSKPQFTKPTNPFNQIHCNSSPFTEKHSIQRYQRETWVSNKTQLTQLDKFQSCQVPQNSASIRDFDIALQLPELKKLLQVLREKRESVNGDGGGERKVGEVYLVGTGPGDPELLTVKAMRVIERADLLLYDRLVSNDVLNLVGEGARLLYVGKTAGYHSRTQVSEFIIFVYVYICIYIYIYVYVYVGIYSVFQHFLELGSLDSFKSWIGM